MPKRPICTKETPIHLKNTYIHSKRDSNLMYNHYAWKNLLSLLYIPKRHLYKKRRTKETYKSQQSLARQQRPMYIKMRPMYTIKRPVYTKKRPMYTKKRHICTKKRPVYIRDVWIPKRNLYIEAWQFDTTYTYSKKYSLETLNVFECV